jgi:hypothetical protein
LGVSQRWQLKQYKQKRFTKESCRKVFTKQSGESKTDFLAFLGEGKFKNTMEKKHKRNLDPGFFLPLTHAHTHGGH